MAETPAERARRFFDETPEPEGTIDELIDGLRSREGTIVTEKEPCPSCDRGLWHPGHACYTYTEWRANIAATPEDPA